MKNTWLTLLLLFTTSQSVPTHTYQIVHTFPHNAHSFTEGLIYDQETGNLWESTGGFSQCGLFEVSLSSGQHIRAAADKCAGKRPGSDWFGEGLTMFQGNLYQLTWSGQTCFVHNRTTLEVIGQHTYQGEGWGLTTDGTSLIMSNGSATITFYNSEFAVIRTILVTLEGRTVENLNELEYIGGEIWSNVWHSTDVVRIDPLTGNVKSVVNFLGLHPTPGERVLNGIAYDSANDRLFVTGKNWEDLFQVKVDGAPSSETVATSSETVATSSAQPTLSTQNSESSSSSEGTPNVTTVVDQVEVASPRMENSKSATGGIVAAIFLSMVAAVGCFGVVYLAFKNQNPAPLRYQRVKKQNLEQKRRGQEFVPDKL